MWRKEAVAKSGYAPLRQEDKGGEGPAGALGTKFGYIRSEIRQVKRGGGGGCQISSNSSVY